MGHAPAVLFAARLILAGVFGVAAVGKLRDLRSSSRALNHFGVPAVLAKPAGVLLPAAELVVAVALLSGATSRIGAAGALLLLMLFAGGISATLLLGRAPECHCFGSFGSETVGWRVLVRDLLMAAVAFLIALPAGHSEHVVMTTAVAGLGLAGGFAGSYVFLRRRHDQAAVSAEADSRLSPVPPAAAPAFALESLDGRVASLDSLGAAGLPIVLVFSNPDCGACKALVPKVARWATAHPGAAVFALISRGTAAANQQIAGEWPGPVLLQRDREVAVAYEIARTPSAVLVGAGGILSLSPARGEAAIMRLLATHVGEAAVT
jgi:thiol-disulfide isomerase/thioredoxin